MDIPGMRPIESFKDPFHCFFAHPNAIILYFNHNVLLIGLGGDFYAKGHVFF